MNGKERALKAFAHQEADRVPVFELTIDNPTAEFVLKRPTLCGFGGKVRGIAQNVALITGKYPQYCHQRLSDEIELWQTLELDVFPLAQPIPRNPNVPEQLSEHEWLFTDSETGQWTKYFYSPESDVYDQVDSSLRQGGLQALEILTTQLEKQEFSEEDWDFTPVDRVVEELGKDMMVIGSADVEIGSTFDWAETFLIGLLDAPDLIHRYLDARLKTTLALTKIMLEHGLHGMHGGYDWASKKGPLFSPRHFRQFVFPRLKQITDLCHSFGVPYIKHTDGNINILLEDMISAGVDGFQAIEPLAGMDIAAIKQKFGQSLTLIGNVDCSTVLVNGPLEAIRRQTIQVIHTAGNGGGFILSSSNSIHPGVKPAYYLEMLATAREFGNYPLPIVKGEEYVTN